ncbi:4-azaleucine resistance probable transporter AzlC [Marinitoga hydrogenitolerans DSM 16785]|uniref:4-azaleucine resistance probable transporter AzlC n=1 Tax=Marinitoga hydrogenitolerans (strain DSM 16785 / JCM 12826 / AT1271) TaxID=1122195 RepID=A0A1M4SH44_MARH1|nr:AzlC family ABC transporter permease [Marinitoga hydrogenitolerans]SHE31482.1 4-azaleucine resistance probable transporter AzlC [Marinitoga hydrogenitolerans DSM 16785]
MKEFIRGLKDGIPISVGYITIAIAFGILVKTYNYPSYVGWLMSLTVFAGASQFVAIEILKNASIFEIIITTFFLNLRHILMSSTIATKAEKNKYIYFLSFGITDETFSIAYFNNKNKISFNYLFGLILISYLGWNLGTVIGLLFSSTFNSNLKNSMSISLYAMFLSILIPNIKKSYYEFLSVIISIIIYIIIRNYLPKYFSIIIVSIVISFIFAYFEKNKFNIGDDNNE